MNVCQDHGQCALAAPDIFDLTVDGLVYEPDQPDSARAAVEEAIAACPVQAISVVGDPA
jgi:ferredoxin